MFYKGPSYMCNITPSNKFVNPNRTDKMAVGGYYHMKTMDETQIR